MINCHPVVPPLNIQVTGSLKPDGAVRREVDAIWDAALLECPHLFDGPILTVTSFSQIYLDVKRSSYRYVMAARQSGELAKILRLRPLAVSGILSCPKGFVLGLRANTVTQGAGHWELAPSGGVEAPLDGSEPDIERDLLKEAREELGISGDEITAGAPVGILEDTGTGVIDIVIPLATSLSPKQILSRHRSRGSSEYAEIMICPAASALREGRIILPESRAIIEEWL